MAVTDYSTTPGSNTAISSINIAEGCAPANINDAIRQIMADIATWRTVSGTLFTGGGTFTGSYTYSNTVTFTVAPVFTDAAGTRTALGLGSAATLASSAVLQSANNLSDLANAATARTNLGLGTMATQASTSYAALAGATFTGSVNVGAAAFTPSVTVAAAASTTINCALSNVFRVTMGTNITTLTVSNPSDGQTINIRFKQDATGGRTVAWPSSFRWQGGSAGTLSTAANARDLLVATWDATDAVWDVSLSKAFA